jgi:dihydroxyacid dehydratase/phosphogluconate dehydratase
MPCNFNLRCLGATVNEGIRAAGGTPMAFDTIAIRAGVTMGTEGLQAALVSREVIADWVELAGRGYLFAGLVALGACDKTIPGLHGYLLLTPHRRHSLRQRRLPDRLCHPGRARGPRCCPSSS